MAKNKAKDLNDIGISLELIPLVLKGESFDYSKFYGVQIAYLFYIFKHFYVFIIMIKDILMLSDDQILAMPNPSETLEELEKT